MMDRNLDWDQNTMPSEILTQIYEQEKEDSDRTVTNLHALAFAIGKARALELLFKDPRNTG